MYRLSDVIIIMTSFYITKEELCCTSLLPLTGDYVVGVSLFVCQLSVFMITLKLMNSSFSALLCGLGLTWKDPCHFWI